VTWFAKSVGIPFVPVSPTGFLPLPAKWYIRFGEPIDLSDYPPEAAEDRLLVNRLADAVRAQIQEMIDVTLAARKSVFFG
jgi:1-acyl-sn-glycerol-3-phosphate acyltransferase